MTNKGISPRKKPTQTRSKERVQKIIDATKKILDRDGLDGVTAIRVAEEARVNVASFYQYFPKKEAVLYAVFQGWIGWALTCFDSVEEKAFLKSDWRFFFQQLGESVFSGNYITEKAAAELLHAMELYPTLKAVNEKHGNEVAARLSGYLSAYGSDWDREKLNDLGYFLFHSANTLFRNAREQEGGREERFLLWGSQMLLGVIAECLGD